MTQPTRPRLARTLPGSASDNTLMAALADMQAELRAQGVPDNVNRAGLTPQEDGTWLAEAWQSVDEYTWGYE